jgi:IS30 family transposase
MDMVAAADRVYPHAGVLRRTRTKRIAQVQARRHLRPAAQSELREPLVACQGRTRNTRMQRPRGQDRRGRITDLVDIHMRPSEVNDREMPSLWHGNFIKNSVNVPALALPIDRTSRLVPLAKMDEALAGSAPAYCHQSHLIDSGMAFRTCNRLY